MQRTIYFYDLETSGFKAREDRIMQFAGQRVGQDLKPIGEPHNFLIKMAEDILPDPGAILVTGITPQQTLADGITEAEFLEIFYKEIAIAGTVFVGFNNVRFDDEFIRYLNFRNFYDAYEWQWSNERSRWDILDAVRMTRALLPEGISWPVDDEARATNRLEELARANQLDHYQAHDALSDVLVTIDLARLIKTKQPKLYEFLFKLRDRKQVELVVNQPRPFIYTSGKYPSEFEKTTVAYMVGSVPNQPAAFVYDLRYDPTPYKDLSSEELAKLWQYDPERKESLPVKTIKYNRCPAVAPITAMRPEDAKRLKLSKQDIDDNLEKLKQIKDFGSRLVEASKILNEFRESSRRGSYDANLYDGFFEESDRQAIKSVHQHKSSELPGLNIDFKDKRLREMWPLYLARNYANLLSSEQRETWDKYRRDKLLKGGTNSKTAKYFATLSAMSQNPALQDKVDLISELQLWGESIMPLDEEFVE